MKIKCKRFCSLYCSGTNQESREEMINNIIDVENIPIENIINISSNSDLTYATLWYKE